MHVDIHHVLRMPVHHCVLQVEPFEICDSRGLYLLWETKETA